jgi:signal transduction histidine kinase
MIIRAKPSVTNQAVSVIEERLLKAYNALSGSHVTRRLLQRRVVIDDHPASEIAPVEHLPGRLSLPLLRGSNVIGIIELGHNDPQLYADPELRMMLIVANTTTTALENARLYQELVARAVSLQHAIDELAEVDRLRNELIQNISHELRTPLTFVAGYVELLRTGEMGDLQPEQLSSLEIVAAKTQVLIRLVSDILAQERSAGLSLEFVMVNLAELAERAVQGMRAASNEAAIQIVMEINPLVEPVLADPTRMGQVFDNLLGNALKFSSSGDTITIRVIPQAKSVRVEIEDTGIGIPADKLPHLFQRFYQVDDTPKRRRGGVGLGLAICKQIIEAHGGIIAVQSEEGVGSTFYFELPIVNLCE